MKNKALQHLRQLIYEEQKSKFPNMPDHAIPINTFDNLKPEKKIKKRIERFLNLLPDCRANIIENRGQRIDNRKTYVDVVGFHRTIGSVEYRGSGMKRGISDLQAVIQGKAVDIEVKRVYKNGRDRQSKYQKEQQRKIEEAGGIYLIVKDFNDFYEQWVKMYNI